MADYIHKSRGMSLVRRLVGRHIARSNTLGTPPPDITIPFEKAREMIGEHKKWDSRARELIDLGVEVEKMLYDPAFDTPLKQKKLKRLVNNINTLLLIIKNL